VCESGGGHLELPVPNKPDGFCGCETTPRTGTVQLKADCADDTWQVTAKCAYTHDPIKLEQKSSTQQETNRKRQEKRKKRKNNNKIK